MHLVNVQSASIGQPWHGGAFIPLAANVSALANHIHHHRSKLRTCGRLCCVILVFPGQSRSLSRCPPSPPTLMVRDEWNLSSVTNKKCIPTRHLDAHTRTEIDFVNLLWTVAVGTVCECGLIMLV